jgi:hypothetical protein
MVVIGLRIGRYLVAEFVGVAIGGWEMGRQNLADFLNAEDHAPFEVVISKFRLHVVANAIPIGWSHFCIDSSIAKDGKLLCVGNQIDKNAVAFNGLLHTQFGKGCRRRRHDIIAFELVADVHTNFR